MTEPTTLLDCLARAARSSVGVHFAERAGDDAFHGYAEIYERALAVAASLQELGIERGDRVAVAVPTGLDFYDSFFGVVLAGAVPV